MTGNKNRFSPTGTLNFALENKEEFEDSVNRYMEGREYTWEELASVLDKAIEDHCPPERERSISRG